MAGFVPAPTLYYTYINTSSVIIYLTTGDIFPKYPGNTMYI